MWKGLGSLLAQNPAKKGMMQSVASALTVEDAVRAINEAHPRLAGHGKVESAANGVLIIRAKNSIGMQEFTLRKNQLMQTLKDRGISVRDIRVCLEFANEREYDA